MHIPVHEELKRDRYLIVIISVLFIIITILFIILSHSPYCTLTNGGFNDRQKYVLLVFI